MLKHIIALTAAGFSLSALASNTSSFNHLTVDKQQTNEYIVVFNADADKDKTRILMQNLNERRLSNSQPLRSFTNINGFHGELSKSQLAALKQNPAVKSIEPNRVINLGPTTVESKQMYRRASTAWGIDRIDQTYLPIDGHFSPAGFGSGVHAYVLSTGIRTTHNEFNGRASWAFTASDINDGNNDDNGHGTHMAGTLAGNSYGIASDANVYSVKILNSKGEGTLAGLIEGIEYVTNNHQAPAVAAIGVTTGYSSALNDAITASTVAGVSIAVPSGDEGKNACNYSPASAEAAITVAATFEDDRASMYSNHGNCVDIYAPGLYVKSAWHTGDHVNNSISHSPIAAAHVAGAAAIIRGLDNSCPPHEVKNHLRYRGNWNRLTQVPTATPNLMLSVYTPQDASPTCYSEPNQTDWITFFHSHNQLTDLTHMNQWRDRETEAEYEVNLSNKSLYDNDIPSTPLGITRTNGIKLTGNNLTHVDFMQGVISVANNFYLNRNPITNFSGLSELSAVRGILNISDIPVTSLEGLNNLQSAGGLYLSSNPNLNDISALSKLSSIGYGINTGYEYVGITSNPNLQNVNGLENLSSVGESLYLSNNDLRNVDGLASLTYVGDNLDLSSNENLTSLAGLAKLRSVGESLNLNGLTSLTSLEGLNSLQRIGRSFSITSLTNLTDISALANLHTIERGWMYINDPSTYTQKPPLGSPFCNAISETGGDGGLNIYYKYSKISRSQICQ